jgi:HlyD family secretion protein
MNNPGTILLTIADLSVMEAEIEVDETDVVDVRLGQNVKVTVDAFPDTVLSAMVTEVGSSARRDFANPGETSADFPVVVRLTETIPGLRPGLSATAEIVTARRSDVPSVSIGALGYRDPRAEARHFERRGRRDRGSAHADEDDDADEDESDDTSAAGDSLASSRKRDETYGLFVVENKRARFTPVTVGITGERHIEITGGVPDGAEVVAGPFQVLREIRSGDRVKPESRKKLSQKKK